MKSLLSSKNLYMHSHLYRIRHLCHTSTQDHTTAEKILTLLNKCHWNWEGLLESSYKQYINSNIVHSIVLQHNSICHSKRLLDFFVWCCFQDSIPQKLDSFTFLAVSFCVSGPFLYAKKILNLMEKSQFPVGDITDSIARSCRDLGVYGKDSGAVFDVLFGVYRKSGKWEKTVDLFLAVLENGEFLPGLLCCNSLLKDLQKFSKMDLFWKVYNAMVDANICPNAYTYGYLIKAYCRDGKAIEGKNSLLEMEERGIVPDVVQYNSVISCFCKQGEFTEAFKLHDEMCEKNVVPNIVTYNVMINGLCKWGDMERARGLFDGIANKELVPNKVTYFTIIDGYCRCGELDIAKEFICMYIAARKAGELAGLGDIEPSQQVIR